MELGLGTVQFGLAYGVAGPGSVVDPDEARRILWSAWDRGVTTLDTAPAYGDIEQRLSALCGDRPFRIFSKISALPASMTPREQATWCLESAKRSYERLGDRLCGLLFHDDSDFRRLSLASCLEPLIGWAEQLDIAIGTSTYEPTIVAELGELIGVAQVPGNAFDQRIVEVTPPANVEVHLRSAFLQGLLLMRGEDASARVPEGRVALNDWAAWCATRGKAPLDAALSVAKSFPVDVCLVGVQDLRQFDDIADAWEATDSCAAPELRVTNPAVVDPRRWRTEIRN